MRRPPGRFAALLVALSAACGQRPQPAPESPVATQIEDRTVGVRGAAVHVAAAGPEGAPAVLFLHGARFSAATWVELGTLAALAREGLRAIAVDLPGFGDSPAGGPPRDEFVVALLDALSLERAVLVSPSLSGRWAIPAVTRHPERFSGWVAVAPVGIEEHAEELANLDLDTLAIWGSEDAVVPLGIGRRLTELVGDARLEVLDGARHPCYLDQPDRFAQLVSEFALR